MTIYIIWFALFGLIILSFFSKNISIWIPLIFYISMVVVRVKQKIGDYQDWKKKSRWDENLAIHNLNMERVGTERILNDPMNFDSQEISNNAEYEQKIRKRQLEVGLINCLLLK